MNSLLSLFVQLMILCELVLPVNLAQAVGVANSPELTAFNNTHSSHQTSSTHVASSGFGFSSTIPFKQDAILATGSNESLTNMVVIFVLFMLMVWSVYWFKKSSTFRKTKIGQRNFLTQFLTKKYKLTAIQIRSSTRITPRHSLHEVHWQGQNMLIGCSDQTISLLTHFPLKSEDGEKLSTGETLPPKEA